MASLLPARPLEKRSPGTDWSNLQGRVGRTTPEPRQPGSLHRVNLGSSVRTSSAWRRCHPHTHSGHSLAKEACLSPSLGFLCAWLCPTPTPRDSPPGSPEEAGLSAPGHRGLRQGADGHPSLREHALCLLGLAGSHPGAPGYPRERGFAGPSSTVSHLWALWPRRVCSEDPAPFGRRRTDPPRSQSFPPAGLRTALPAPAGVGGPSAAPSSVSCGLGPRPGPPRSTARAPCAHRGVHGAPVGRVPAPAQPAGSHHEALGGMLRGGEQLGAVTATGCRTEGRGG